MLTARSTTALLVAAAMLAGCAGTTTDPTAATANATEATAAEVTTSPEPDATETETASTEPIATEGEPADEVVVEPLTVAVTATPDPMTGVNVEVTTTGFTWAPEHASGEPVEGEGHAHLYVDGEKVGRLYTPWFHVGGLAPGDHEVRVTLNGNDHTDLDVDGEAVAATTTVEAPDAGAMHGDPTPHEAAEPMTVSATVTPDAKAGANLQVTTSGFAWAPARASSMHVEGEGHAHVYVDGEKVGRLYGEWLHLSLDPGEHEVRVTLNGNDHGDYLVGGEPVAAVATVTVDEADMAGH